MSIPKYTNPVLERLKPEGWEFLYNYDVRKGIPLGSKPSDGFATTREQIEQKLRSVPGITDVRIERQAFSGAGRLPLNYHAVYVKRARQ